MALSPRLLKGSTFTPRSISGLALWLDASDGATLFQNSDGTVPATATSDPVGYWADKSGNGRHAVMSVSANRPTVGSSSTAGKNAVRNNGTGTVALQVAAWPYTAGNTQFAVFNGAAINQAVYQRGSLNDEPRMAIQGGTLPALHATRGGSSAAQTSSVVGYPLSQWAIGATLFNTSLGRAYRDGVYGADTTDSQTFSGDQELRLLSLPSNIYGINGGIAEFLYYDRQLTATEVSRVASYLSRRWGITLAPTVSNADAQNWIDRVYQNGGTVSSATAAAVNQFCVDLENAPGGSIRDRFFRLNLFCGGTSGTAVGLNSALVPLFRGPSLGGTQYGATTDTNVGGLFVPANYNETGATGGLRGNGSTQYLNTGLQQASVSGDGTGHMSAYYRHKTNPASTWRLIGAGVSGGSNDYFYDVAISAGAVLRRNCHGGNSATFDNSATQIPAWATNHLGMSRTTNTVLRDWFGSSIFGGTTSTVTPTGLAADIFVYAYNLSGTGAIIHSEVTLGGYSIGAALNDTQIAAFRAAMDAFQSTLGRNVSVP